MDTTHLARFREGETKKPPAGPFEVPRHFAFGRVLVFDQSLGATGWVILQSGEDGLVVPRAGSFLLKPENYPAGNEGSLLRAMEVHRRALAIMYKHPDQFVGVLHETPPVGGRMARPESSLLSALAVRLAAQEFDAPLEMVQNQHSKRVLTGSPNAEKKVWHKALDRYPITGKHLVTNEGQRDALALGLTHFIDLWEKHHG